MIGVVGEQVQRPAVVGHLAGAVGPDDDPDGVLVDAGPGFEAASEVRTGGQNTAQRTLPGRRSSWPVPGSRCRRGSSPAGKRLKSLFIVAARTVCVGPAPVTGAVSSCKLSLTRCGLAPARLDQVPDARGTGHRVEQVRPFRFARRFVLEEPVQRLPGVGHLLHRPQAGQVGAGHRPERRGVDPPPCDRGTLGEERRPQDGVARRAESRSSCRCTRTARRSARGAGPR